MTLTRRNQWIVGIAVLCVLVGWFYLRDREKTIAQVQQDIDATVAAREELASVVPLLDAETVKPPPDPEPDVSGWLAQHALGDLERRVVSNQRASSGQGATLHIRDMQPQELAHLFNVLTTVNIQVKQFQLEDFSGSGKWDVTLTVSSPAKPKSGP